LKNNGLYLAKDNMNLASNDATAIIVIRLEVITKNR